MAGGGAAKTRPVTGYSGRGASDGKEWVGTGMHMRCTILWEENKEDCGWLV